MANKFEIVRMKPGQQADVAAVANSAFGFGGEGSMDFMRDWPYLWNDERADNYWLAVADGKIVACVGSYPLTVRVAGASFRSACVGQVGTLPEWRGQGAMSAILRAVTAEMDGGEYDFTWLGGDRQRYGRFGWAFGGVKHWCTTNAKYLPDPPDASTVRAMDPKRDGEMIWQYTQSMPYAIGFNRREFEQLLSIRDVGGVVSDGAWVVFRGPMKRPRVLLADGPTDRVAALMAHLSQQATGENNPDGGIAFEAGPYDSALARAALAHYASMEQQQVGGFRMCDMAGYFSRACGAVQPAIAGGSDELSLRNTDTGQAVRIVCENGKLSVDDHVGTDVREMTTTQLSEVAFSMLPLDVVLPGLVADSPLRALLRMPVYLPFGFYAM